MLQINNGSTAAVKIKWDRITLPLKEGTPVNIGGNIANDGTAVGLVINTVRTKPIGVFDKLMVLVSGDVELAEVEKSAGITLTTDAKAAMSAINFHLPDGSVDDSRDKDTHYTLPAATTDALGGVKMAENVADSEAEALATLVTNFNALLASLKAAGIMEPDADASES